MSASKFATHRRWTLGVKMTSARATNQEWHLLFLLQRLRPRHRMEPSVLLLFSFSSPALLQLDVVWKKLTNLSFVLQTNRNVFFFASQLTELMLELNVWSGYRRVCALCSWSIPAEILPSKSGRSYLTSVGASVQRGTAWLYTHWCCERFACSKCCSEWQQYTTDRFSRSSTPDCGWLMRIFLCLGDGGVHT